MILLHRIIFIVPVLFLSLQTSNSAKINTPRVLLPWFMDLHVNFTFEIIEGGCYTWSLSRDDIIDIEPLYDDSWGHCSRAARVSVSKTCVPPGSVIILAEETNTGEILRGDVDIAEISALKVISTTWKLYLEEAPEAFEVVAYDEDGNTFSTLEGVSFKWSIENLGNDVGEDPLVKLVRWRDTDYEAPRGVADLEGRGLRTSSVLLYGQAMGKSSVTVCLGNICTDFALTVVASVVLTPAVASIAMGDTLRYRVVRARAGRLTIQEIADTLYYLKVPDDTIATLQDTISLVRGDNFGTSNVLLLSGTTQVASAVLNVVEPHGIRVSIRPSSLIIRGEPFLVHCTVLDHNGHPLTAGDKLLIRLTVSGEADVDLLSSTENGTLTDAVARNAGPLVVNAGLVSVAGKTLYKKVEGQVTAVAVDPLEVVPPELYVAWTDVIQEIPLNHRGGGDEPVTWGDVDEQRGPSALSLSPAGVVSVRGVGEVGARVALANYGHVRAYGRVWSAVPEYMQVSSSGQARVGKPHYLHVALTGTHPETGELFNFDRCNCGSFAVSLLEGPEPHNVTAATIVPPVEGACCVLEAVWTDRGVCTVRVSRGRAGDAARVIVRSAPRVVWPGQAAALVGASLPVLALGDSLRPLSGEPRVAELARRDGPPPHRHPDMQLFTIKCKRKGDTSLALVSETEEERETAEFEVACAPHVSRIRLEPPDTPGNCSQGPRLWLRPGHEVKVKVTLLDAIGRELLDEQGPKAAWEISPKHAGIEYRSADRLFIETHPEYAPVPVPYKYYQVVVADEQAVGWSGNLKVTIPDATATIQAKVVAPLLVDPVKISIAWENEAVTNIASVTGGSGRYIVEAGAGATGVIEEGALSARVPGPGSYELRVSDLCVPHERQIVEVHIEEILSIEVSTARAIGVGGCAPLAALIKGVSHRYLVAGREPEWRVAGQVAVREGRLCGLREGAGRVRAGLGGVWSAELEVLVFPPLEIVPAKARLPAGARVQLRHRGGPPAHLATLHYQTVDGVSHAEVSGSGLLHGLAIGGARVRLTARDIANVEMASAEASVEVVAITGLRVGAATQTLLVGAPGPLWLEAEGLGPRVLAGLPARVTWAVRDAQAARLHRTHHDDLLERSVSEGLTVRVVPLKPGVITIDVRVRNLGQSAETRSWDSTIEILAVSDIRASVDGMPSELAAGDRLALAVGSTIRLKSLPRGEWKIYDENKAFQLTASGELRAVQPGFAVVFVGHTDDRTRLHRETAISVEAAVPHYCTVQPSADDAEAAIRLVMRNAIGRELLAPDANVSALAPHGGHSRRSAHSALGNELLITNLDATGAFMTVQGTVGGVTLKDEVWVAGSEQQTERIIATGGWAVCLEGGGWRAPPSVSLFEGSGVTLAVLTKDGSAKHVLRADRPPRVATIHQLPIDKVEFLPGEWPSSMVPLSITGHGLQRSPVACTEQQKDRMVGVEVELPFTCHAQAPHDAKAVMDIFEGRMGCSILPGSPVVDATEVELCAEIGVSRACTRVPLLPLLTLDANRISLLNPPTEFTILGNPRALKLVKLAPSPGLKLETVLKTGELTVLVRSEDISCGHGWVTVHSKLTAQEMRVEVEKECDVACGTLLGAIFSLLKPYLSTLASVAAVVGAYLYVQSKLATKGQIKMPTQPGQTVLPSMEATPPPLNRSTWSRSPYASNGPVAPIYGDASVMPDTSFSPNSSRLHSRFL